MDEKERWQEVDRLFEEALELPAEERPAYLDEHCADPELRAQVERLLDRAEAASDTLEPGGALEGPLADELARELETPAGGPLSESPGTIIDGFRLLRVLGEGGMGQVWEAEQLIPVRRRVALKIIKWGMDTRDVIGRFEGERQALALMSHPNIARVFDGGSTEAGRPYFVMELVPGPPLTEYCDEEGLGLVERLELFMRVCEGVQHAHQKGIIHRDLKPSNVLVAVEEGRPVPKIIDFGVARATDQRLTEHTVFTAHGQLIGTPEYMSPEQASVGGDIDTRTDVYSLGVLLYELLVGVKPFDGRELRRESFEELLRRIRETDPARPSQRLGTLGGESRTVAGQRGTEPSTLAKRLRGDLDWIVMKALEKDRGRRYDSPGELAADLRRHLDHQPVVAGPPGAAYRVRKLVRRHRLLVAAAGMVAAALIAGAAVSTWQAVRATHAERAAREEAETARQVSDFLVGLFEVSDPGVARGEDLTAREILDEGSERIREELAGQPLIRARLMATMAEIYRKLGFYDEADGLIRGALEIRERELGEDDLEVVDTVFKQALLEIERGNDDGAAELLASCLERYEEALGPEDVKVADVLSEQGDLARRRGRLEESEALHLRALAIREAALGPGHPRVALSLNGLAGAYYRQGRYEEAEKAQRRALAIREATLGEDHPDTASVIMTLASSVGEQGRDADAEKLLLRALAIFEKTLGPEHRQVASALINLGGSRSHLGKQREAEADFLRAASIKEKVFGPDHPEVATALVNLGQIHLLLGEFDAAEEELQRAVEIGETHLGPDHNLVIVCLNILGDLYQRQARYDEAALPLERALAAAERALGPDHPQGAQAARNLAAVRLGQGRPKEAEELYRRALAVQERTYGLEHPVLSATLSGLGGVMLREGRLEEARELRQRALDIYEKALGPAHPGVAAALVLLGEVHRAAGDWEAAETVYRRALAIEEQRRDGVDSDTADVLHGLAAVAAARGELESARAMYARALEIRLDALGPEHPDTRETQAAYDALRSPGGTGA